MNNNRLDKVIQKLNMMGAQIMGSNSFSILYLIGDEFYIVKLGEKENIDIHIDSLNYGLSPYFTSISTVTNVSMGVVTGKSLMPLHEATQLYVASSDSNIIARHKKCIIYSTYEGRTYQAANVCGDYPIIGIHTESKKLYIVNYKGKKLNVTKYFRNVEYLSLIISYSRDTGLYKIGYGVTVVKSGNKNNAPTSAMYNTGYNKFAYKMRYWFVKVDAELETVIYNDKLEEHKIRNK